MQRWIAKNPQYLPVVGDTAYTLWPPRSFYHRRLAMARVMWLLKEQGDIVGHLNASGALADRFTARGLMVPPQLWVLVNDMVEAGLLMVERTGKRTRTIKLRPGVPMPPNPWAVDRVMGTAVQAADDPLARLKVAQAVFGQSDPEPAPEPEPGAAPEPAPERRAEPEPTPEPDEPEPETEPATLVALPAPPAPETPSDAQTKLLAIMRLAGDLMVDVAVPGPAALPDVDVEVRERLAAALERCTQLEAQLKREADRRRDAQAAAESHSKALTAERRAKRMVENNLARLVESIKRRGQEPGAQELAQLDRIMREPPRAS